MVQGKYKLVVAQPDPSIMSSKQIKNGWRYPNGSWVEPVAAFGCDKYKDRTNFQPCLFDLEADPREVLTLTMALIPLTLVMMPTMEA